MKYFRNGEKLTKSYIVQKMMGNGEYGKYVPDGVNPQSLSREFLLSVSPVINIYIVSCIYRPYFIRPFPPNRKGAIRE